MLFFPTGPSFMIVVCLLLTSFCTSVLAVNEPFLDGRDIRSSIPEDKCVCEYDPEIPEGWLECEAKCLDHQEKMYLSKKDLSHLTRQVCVCPEDVPDCPCPLQPPPDCCYTNVAKRENEASITPALHARSCPPSGVICHLTSDGIQCIPCIEKRIICPLYAREESEATVCLASRADGRIKCPSCPQCQPCAYKRAVDDTAAIWCPPCFPPHPPNCPQCWYNAFGVVQCPSCPWPPATSTKPPLPSHTFCSLSKKYCIANPDGTYRCPGCGPIPVTLEA